MEQISKLPVDVETWKLLKYDSNYYVPHNPLDTVALSTIKFYTNQLKQLNLSEKNKAILRDSINRIKKLTNF